MIRVLIADDNSLVRGSIQVMLEQIHDVEVVGEAQDGEEAIALVENLQPDVVVMDISMPRLDGLQATEQIRSLKTAAHVLILSMHAAPTFVQQALRKGARGYILKRTISEELVPALYQVNEGKYYLSQSLRETIGARQGD